MVLGVRVKTNQILESKMREANFASLDAFRSTLRSHPLVADYVCDLLIARGVVALRDDGSVVGVAASESAVRSGRSSPTKDSPQKGEWKDHWPDRGEVIEYLTSEDEDGNKGAFFGALQEYLKDMGEPHSHWIVLHALWNLSAAGIIEKKGKRYCVTEAGEIKYPSNYNAMTQALKKVGPPYKVDLVVAALKAIPGSNFFGKHSAYNDEPMDQGHVDANVKNRKNDGIL